MSNKHPPPLEALSGEALGTVLENVIDAYAKAVEKHPVYAEYVLNEKADLAWIQENLKKARIALANESSADKVNNCEWMESLEAWKKAMVSETAEDCDAWEKNFCEETYQVMATMIRYLQLGRRQIGTHRRQLAWRKASAGKASSKA